MLSATTEMAGKARATPAATHPAGWIRAPMKTPVVSRVIRNPFARAVTLPRVPLQSQLSTVRYAAVQLIAAPPLRCPSRPGRKRLLRNLRLPGRSQTEISNSTSHLAPQTHRLPTLPQSLRRSRRPRHPRWISIFPLKRFDELRLGTVCPLNKFDSTKLDLNIRFGTFG